MNRKPGFTLIELLIVITVLAIVVAIALPGLLRARLSTNESAAIGAMRSLTTAQTQFRGAIIKDRDEDSTGEYGYFTELAGEIAAPIGVTTGAKAYPALINSILSLFNSFQQSLACTINASGVRIL